MVSIVIPVYNTSRFLRDSLDSVINQTYTDLEIIVVDDGSTDCSGLICDEYMRDARVKVVHQENKGISGARNTALDLATGDYIAFLDSDDFYYPDMIQTMIEGIEKNGADIAVCDYETINLQGKLKWKKNKKQLRLGIKEEKTLSANEVVDEIINKKFGTCVWNKLYKKELWDSLRFPEGHVYEDVWVLPKLLEESKKIHIIPRPLILYHRRPFSITVTHNKNNSEDHIIARNILADFVENHSSYVSDKKALRLFYEDNARIITIRYAELVHIEGKSESTEILKDDILKKWDLLDGNIKCLESKVVFYLLKTIPSLILPARSIFFNTKRFFSRKDIM